MESSFTLLDLAAQANAVASRIRAYSVAEKLTWLKHPGTLTPARHPMLRATYIFTSRIGIRTVITLTDEGQVYIVDNHTTRPLDSGV